MMSPSSFLCRICVESIPSSTDIDFSGQFSGHFSMIVIDMTMYSAFSRATRSYDLTRSKDSLKEWSASVFPGQSCDSHGRRASDTKSRERPVSYMRIGSLWRPTRSRRRTRTNFPRPERDEKNHQHIFQRERENL
jgi:hypothetical protein